MCHSSHKHHAMHACCPKLSASCVVCQCGLCAQTHMLLQLMHIALQPLQLLVHRSTQVVAADHTITFSVVYCAWCCCCCCRDGKLADRLEQASQIVKTAYSECPSYDMVRCWTMIHVVVLLLRIVCRVQRIVSCFPFCATSVVLIHIMLVGLRSRSQQASCSKQGLHGQTCMHMHTSSPQPTNILT
jgi:hypothetical protein